MCDNKTAGEKHDEVMVTRVSTTLVVFFSLFVLGLIALLVLIFLKPEGIGKEPLGPWESLVCKGGLVVGTPLMICYFLGILKYRLILSTNEIVCKELFFSRIIPIDKVEKIEWCTNEKYYSWVVVIYPKGQKKFRPEIPWLSDGRGVVRYLRETIPLEKQFGWKEYYRHNRSRMRIGTSSDEQFAAFFRQFVDPKQRKAPLRALLICGEIVGFLVLSVFIGFKLVVNPLLMSGFMTILFLCFSTFILWPRKKSQSEESNIEPCSVFIKIAVALFFLYILFLGLAAMWNWFPGRLFDKLAFLALCIGLSGGLSLHFYVSWKGAKENKAKRQLAREAEDAECEKNAELLLPPELER